MDKIKEFMPKLNKSPNFLTKKKKKNDNYIKCSRKRVHKETLFMYYQCYFISMIARPWIIELGYILGIKF